MPTGHLSVAVNSQICQSRVAAQSVPQPIRVQLLALDQSVRWFKMKEINCHLASVDHSPLNRGPWGKVAVMLELYQLILFSKLGKAFWLEFPKGESGGHQHFSNKNLVSVLYLKETVYKCIFPAKFRSTQPFPTNTQNEPIKRGDLCLVFINIL